MKKEMNVELYRLYRKMGSTIFMCNTTLLSLIIINNFINDQPVDILKTAALTFGSVGSGYLYHKGKEELNNQKKLQLTYPRRSK